MYRDGVRPVGSVPEDISAHGAYDMASSVSEWVEWTNTDFPTRAISGRYSKSLGPHPPVNTELLDHGGRFWLGFRCAKDVPQ